MRSLIIWLILCTVCLGQGIVSPSVGTRDVPIPIEHAKGAKLSGIFAVAKNGVVVWQV